MILKIDNNLLLIDGKILCIPTEPEPFIPTEPDKDTIYENIESYIANPITIDLNDGERLVAVSEVLKVSSNIISPIAEVGEYKVHVVTDVRVAKVITITITNPRESLAFDAIHKIEDIYNLVQPDERIIFITRHAARASDTSVYGDLSSTGINQCKTLGSKLSNNNIDLSKSYIGGSKKYRALNTAYQITKAMGVTYPSNYDYKTDEANKFEWLMERDFFTDVNGGSSGISLSLNAYYCYIDENAYTGEYIDNKKAETEGVDGDGLPHINKVPNHVNTKSQIIIDNAVKIAKEKNSDLSWFGTHDKVICPLTAYVTNRKNPLYIDRSKTSKYVQMNVSPTGTTTTGTWSIPLIGGIAIIVNKTTDKRSIYAFDSGF